MKENLWKAIEAYRMAGGREEHWRNRDALDQMIEQLVCEAAAAPDLLEALQNLLKVHEGEGGTRYHAGDIARAAIAKATGQAS